MSGEQPRCDTRRLIDCVRREPDAVALDHEATPHELAELAAIHIVGRGRSERRGAKRREVGMVGKRISLSGGSCSPAVDDDVVERAERLSVELVEGRDVEPQRARVSDSLRDRIADLGDAFGRDEPAAEGRCTAFARQGLQVCGQDRASLGDDALDRPVRVGLAHRPHGSDLDDLAAPDGLGSTALAEHEPIARQQRQGERDADAHETCRTGCDRVSSDHAELRRMLARPDAHRVRTATGHLVAERAQRLQLGVEDSRGLPP